MVTPGDRAADGELPDEQRASTLTKLTSAQIRDGQGGVKLDALTTNQRQALVQNTPLWFYILREAELNAGRLKGVGARIVAETFHRAIEGSQFSIVNDTSFHPTLGPTLDLPHGRSAALRVRGQEVASGSTRIASEVGTHLWYTDDAVVGRQRVQHRP